MSDWDEPSTGWNTGSNENYWQGSEKPFEASDDVDFTKKTAKSNGHPKPMNGSSKDHDGYQNGTSNGHGNTWDETGEASGVADGNASYDNAGDGNFGGAVGGACRNCGQDGHFARECPEAKKNDGKCYNCGEEGHNKAECTNARVEREFTGTCRLCNEEGHRAAECPTKGPEVCRNCQEEGHKASECEGNRALEYAGVPDMTKDEGWALLEQASKDRDIDDFKTALQIYVKADRDMTYPVMERKMRAAKFSIYLIAIEKELPISMTSVNLQGKSACKYVVGFYYSPKLQRAKFAESWPPTPEENLVRLEEAGAVMDQTQLQCRNCDQLGHVSKNCPAEKVERPKDEITCSNCNEIGHRQRDCKQPRQIRGACKNCGQPGHKVADCTEPRSAEGVECRKCNEMGHFSKDCPNSQGGGGRGCRNCGEEGHMAKECDKPKNPDMVTCRNCDKMGHFSRDCPEPKDWSRVKCSNCAEMGHTIKRCKQPIAGEEGGDGGLDYPSGSGGFDNAATSGGFESGAGAEPGGW